MLENAAQRPEIEEMAVQHTSIRPAAVAGTFYPGDEARLRAQLAAMLDRARAESPVQSGATEVAPPRPPKILIAPHAGYVYSGPVAASAYRLLEAHRDLIRRVVVIGPAHRVAFRGIAVPAADAFQTPLGRVAVDAQALRSILALPQVGASDAPHALEHSLEVHLPFLQAVLGEFSIVPLVVGHCSPRDVAQVLEALWGGEETLIVVSSDLSHYHEHALATRIDGATVRSILGMQPTLDHQQACGATPVNAALLCAERHGLRARLLDLRNSGDTAGGRDRVVGYCSIAFHEAPGEDVRA